MAAAGDRLEQVDVEGVPHWFDPSVPARTTRGEAAHLLTTYDEVTLTYPTVGFPSAESVPEPEDFPWYTAVVVDETRVGTWRRTVRRDRVVVETLLAPGTTPRQHDLVDAAVERLGQFLELPVERVRGAT